MIKLLTMITLALAASACASKAQTPTDARAQSALSMKAVDRVSFIDSFGAVVASYEGEYTCAQGFTSLKLDVGELYPDGTRYASFAFGANAPNPSVQSGGFIMQGRVDLAGGGITLKPIKWLYRPAGYVWVALSGVAERDGNVLEGTVIGPGCTRFLLNRTR